MIPALLGLTANNNLRWAHYKVKAQWVNIAQKAAARLCDVDARTIYDRISKRTGVPWYVIAVIHEREAGQHWGANISQGDPWNRVSVHVPKGRGPFKNFEDAAYDALVNCAPYAAKWYDWTPGGALTLLEQYNGLGYSRRGIPSPYIWSGTDQYVKGKYVADGVFDPNAVDQQLGCALLFDTMNVYPKTLAPTASPKAIAPAASVASPPESPAPTPLPAAPLETDPAMVGAGAAAVVAGVAATWNYGPYVIGVTLAVLAIVGLVIYLHHRGK